VYTESLARATVPDAVHVFNMYQHKQSNGQFRIQKVPDPV